MRVEDVMSKSIVTCRVEDTGAAAARIMLPVIDEERRVVRVCGVSDIARASGSADGIPADEVALTICEIARPHGYSSTVQT